MTETNTVYTVTPPDLKISLNGPNVMLLGVTINDVKPYTDLFDKTFPTVENTFFVGDPESLEENIAWYRAVIGAVGYVFIDLDQAAIEEFFLARQAAENDEILVFFISRNKTRPALVSLLNSYNYGIFNSLEEIEKMIQDELKNKS